MKCAKLEYEAVLPKISLTHFKTENSAAELEFEYHRILTMSEFRGQWKIVGWAHAEGAWAKQGSDYLVMLELDDCGEKIRAWIHTACVTFMHMADVARKEPHRIAPL